jgi:hypothetical protein
MTQATHDYSIANDTGSAVRSDLNTLFGEVETANSGTSPPTNLATGKLWYDTGNNVLKQYDGSAWVTLIDSTDLSTDTSLGTSDTLVSSQAAIKSYVDSAAPSNLIAHFTGTSAPSGWSEYTSARGRMIVGLPSGGTDGGTVGTALTNAQDKGTIHNHTESSHRHNTDIINDSSGGQIRWNEVNGNTGSNAAGNHTNRTSTFSGTSYGYKYTSSNAGGGTGTATVSTSDVLAYIQLMVIKKD